MKTTTSIGGRCKRGDTLSRAVLITRTLSRAAMPPERITSRHRPYGAWLLFHCEMEFRELRAFPSHDFISITGRGVPGGRPERDRI